MLDTIKYRWETLCELKTIRKLGDMSYNMLDKTGNSLICIRKSVGERQNPI